MSDLWIFHRRVVPFLALLLLVLTACAGPLEVKYEPKTQSQFRSKESAPIFVSAFEDRRDLSKSHFQNPRTIGKIQTTVSDMTGSELTLSEDVSNLVTRAFARELALSGFIINDTPDKASYIVTGVVSEFSLDVGSKDEIAIGFSAQAKDARSNKTLWSGAESEKQERFAGVMGNSRTTLSNYIGATLQRAVRRSIEGMGAKISVTGADAAPKLETSAPSMEATGSITVRSAEERAKVYIDGVYYGLTPISLDLAPGVYEISVKKKGFKTATEKVSIRQGSTTELEEELEKE